MEEQVESEGNDLPSNEESSVDDDVANSDPGQQHQLEDSSSLNSTPDGAEGSIENDAAPARNHSYLPGTSHPLFPEMMLERRRRIRSSSFSRPSVEGTSKRSRSASDEIVTVTEERNAPLNRSWRENGPTIAPCHRAINRFVELPILELNGVVLFPGSTIPIRLRSRDWIEYLGRQIDAARGIRGILGAEEEVRLGIVTYVDPRPARVLQQRQRRSWMRTAIVNRGTRMQEFWAEYDRLLRDSTSDFDEVESDSENSSDDGVHNGRHQQDRSAQHEQGDPSQRRSSQRPVDPLIGRIGTIATITYTHEDAGGDVADAHQENHTQYSRVWQRHDSGQLIVTALGTGRFRIVSCIDGDDDNGSFRQRHSGVEGDMATVRLYKVEELPDEEFVLPHVELRRQTSSATRSAKTNVPFLMHHDHIIRNVSQVSPVPYFVVRYTWPWRLVGLIRVALDRISEFGGLTNSLPSLPGSDDGMNSSAALPDASLLDPDRFSFWMSCNMSFSEKEKLDLLEMNCTIKRLRYIYRRVLEQEQHESFVCCKTCSRRLSRTSNIFTVGGAEGTTGAYVNEHGIVHQTVTLRKVDEGRVFCSGGPETRESWFPGYSWTITYCNFCHSHLGWKFLLVSSHGQSQESEQDRPGMFWGLSGASITTKLNSSNNE